ncbi:MAG: DNA polymerase III subunit [Colwellia sp.]|nr:DNA polymerase III subunit [Colwellia sp.]
MLPICREKQRQLSHQYQQQTLPHAIILQGGEGAGKNALAKWLIDLLVCQHPLLLRSNDLDDTPLNHACGQCKACLLIKSGSYPDHLLLNSENKTLGVDDVRRGNAFLQKTAHLGQVKSILIPQAQTMTVAAANALLKTLEEPSQNSFIVLLADELETLLPTIVSRCAVYAIRPLVGEALRTQLNSLNLGSAFLSSSKHDETITGDDVFINLSQLAELTDEEVFQQYKAFYTCYLSYLSLGNDESELLMQLTSNKHGMRWLEKITCNLVRSHYLEKEPNVEELSPLNQINKVNQINFSGLDLSVEVLNTIYQAIISSNKLIKSFTQANKQYVVEQLLMLINDIVKPSK